MPAQDARRTAAESLDAVYRRYTEELKRFFSARNRGRPDVEDLVQTVYLQLLRCEPRELIRDYKDYLFRCAWRVLNEENRRTHVEQQRTISGDSASWEALESQSSALWHQDDSKLTLQLAESHRAIESLPTGSQVALMLRYVEGYSYKEIAQTLHITTHAVKMRIARAIAVLRKQMTNTEPE